MPQVGCCTGILGTGQGYRCHGFAGCPPGGMRRTVLARSIRFPCVAAFVVHLFQRGFVPLSQAVLGRSRTTSSGKVGPESWRCNSCFVLACGMKLGLEAIRCTFRRCGADSVVAICCAFWCCGLGHRTFLACLVSWRVWFFMPICCAICRWCRINVAGPSAFGRSRVLVSKLRLSHVASHAKPQLGSQVEGGTLRFRASDLSSGFPVPSPLTRPPLHDQGRPAQY